MSLLRIDLFSSSNHPEEARRLAENLIYVDYDGSISTRQQFLASVKSADLVGEQISNPGVTVHSYGGTKAWKKANPFPGGALYERLAESKRQMGMYSRQSTLIAR